MSELDSLSHSRERQLSEMDRSARIVGWQSVTIICLLRILLEPLPYIYAG